MERDEHRRTGGLGSQPEANASVPVPLPLPREGAFAPFADDPAAIPDAELRTAYRRLGKLYDLAQQLFAEDVLPTLFDRIVAAAVELLDVERALLATLETTPDGEKLLRRAAFQFPATPDGELPVSSTIVSRALKGGEAVLTLDAAQEQQFRDAASVVASQIRSVMCCPLGDPREPTGLLYVDNNVRARAFDRGDLRFLQALASYAHIAIQNLKRAEAARAVVVARAETLERTYGPGHEMVGRSRAIHGLYELIRRVAPARVPVLVLGETGTGKEVVARAIHQESDRRNGPFVPVNMGTVSRETAESQLFGHERGAFTGATAAHPGFFMQASGGTIFLDEVTAAPPDIQVKLLRTLAEGMVRPLGAKRDETVDVRVIAACNVDIDREVREGRFREDLFYRLNVARIELSPLRERRDDIEPLLHHFLQKAAPRKSFDSKALRALCAYAWPGNVRELRNVVEMLAIMSAGETIQLADLPPRLTGSVSNGLPPAPSEDPEELRSVLDRTERAHIQRVLDFTHGNREKAIALLGIARATFYQRLKQYDLMDYVAGG